MSDFNVTIEDVKCELMTKTPTLKEKQEGEIIRASTFATFVKSGSLLRSSLDVYMREQGLWNDDKEKRVVDLKDAIYKGELALKRGGIRKSKGREIAIGIYKNRTDLFDLLIKQNELNVNTAEAQGDNAKFEFLISKCIVYKQSGKPVFADLDDYQENSSEDYAITAATELAVELHGHDKNFDHNLPESKFLSRFGYVDKDLNLINSDGKKIDFDGKVIEEIEVEEIEEQPFLDDDDQPIVE